MSRIAIAMVIVLSVVLAAGATRADHEVYYRYTVLGYVKDVRGKPVPRREITVTRDKTGFSYFGKSDETGLYVVIMRLGDESVGELLTVRSGESAAKLTVKFDVTNQSDERGTRLDLDGGRFVDRAAWFFSTLALVRGSARP